MGGLFDDIFDDDDFEIAGEEELELDDDWNDGPDRQRGATWDTGQKQDLWDANEPWTTSDDSGCGDCDPKSDCGDCADEPPTGPKQKFDVDDFFN